MVMPVHDQTPEALEPIQIGITVDAETKRITYVGVGYHLVMPNGRHHEGGYAWHVPRSGVQAPDEHVAALQTVVDELLKAAAEHERLKL